jgi:hypothetical protein
VEAVRPLLGDRPLGLLPPGGGLVTREERRQDRQIAIDRYEVHLAVIEESMRLEREELAALEEQEGDAGEQERLEDSLERLRGQYDYVRVRFANTRAVPRDYGEHHFTEISRHFHGHADYLVRRARQWELERDLLQAEAREAAREAVARLRVVDGRQRRALERALEPWLAAELPAQADVRRVVETVHAMRWVQHPPAAPDEERAALHRDAREALLRLEGLLLEVDDRIRHTAELWLRSAALAVAAEFAVVAEARLGRVKQRRGGRAHPADARAQQQGDLAAGRSRSGRRRLARARGTTGRRPGRHRWEQPTESGAGTDEQRG